MDAKIDETVIQRFTIALEMGIYYLKEACNDIENNCEICPFNGFCNLEKMENAIKEHHNKYFPME